jgi:hypothetical protein
MRRHMGWSTLIGLLVILGLVGVAAIQQPRYGGTLRVAWEQETSQALTHTGPLACMSIIASGPSSTV